MRRLHLSVHGKAAQGSSVLEEPACQRGHCSGHGLGVQVAAWLTHIKTDTIAYPACTLQYNGKQCNKKVAEGASGDGPGQWYCDRCTAHCQAEWRYMLNLRLEDHTGTEWVTAFQVRCRTGCRHCVGTAALLLQLQPATLALCRESLSRCCTRNPEDVQLGVWC